MMRQNIVLPVQYDNIFVIFRLRKSDNTNITGTHQAGQYNNWENKILLLVKYTFFLLL